MSANLAIIDLTLQPRKHNHIPEWQGRAAQALFYSGLHAIHPMISETIHDLHKWQRNMPKPFTLSTITGAKTVKDMIELHPDNPVKLRLTTLHPHLTRIVLQGVIPQWQHNGFSLHDQPLWIRHTAREKLTYDDLLLLADDSDCITLKMTAPTAFKQTNKGFIARPDPEYVFGSLLNRWNAFSETQLPRQLRETASTHITVIDNHTRQRTLSFARGRKGIIRGFYGTVTYRIHETSAEIRHLFQALALFAPFSGVGVKTTVGMGQTLTISNLQ